MSMHDSIVALTFIADQWTCKQHELLGTLIPYLKEYHQIQLKIIIEFLFKAFLVSD